MVGGEELVFSPRKESVRYQREQIRMLSEWDDNALYNRDKRDTGLLLCVRAKL